MAIFRGYLDGQERSRGDPPSPALITLHANESFCEWGFRFAKHPWPCLMKNDAWRARLLMRFQSKRHGKLDDLRSARHDNPMFCFWAPRKDRVVMLRSTMWSRMGGYGWGLRLLGPIVACSVAFNACCSTIGSSE
jgi:hypothetical protein